MKELFWLKEKPHHSIKELDKSILISLSEKLLFFLFMTVSGILYLCQSFSITGFCSFLLISLFLLYSFLDYLTIFLYDRFSIIIGTVINFEISEKGLFGKKNYFLNTKSVLIKDSKSQNFYEIYGNRLFKFKKGNLIAVYYKENSMVKKEELNKYELIQPLAISLLKSQQGDK